MTHYFSTRAKLWFGAVALVLLVPLVQVLAPGHVPTASALTNCTVSDNSFDAEEAAFLTLINNYRAQNGLQPLTISTNLNRAASWLAVDMGAKSYFSHTDSLGRSPSTRAQNCDYPGGAGENIAAGTVKDTAAEAFEMWRNSSGHNANMLNSSYKTIGIARAYTAGSPYVWYWVTDFGLVLDGSGGSTPTPTPQAGPTFQFTSSSYSASEAAGGIDVVVQRIGGSGTASVTCRTTPTGSSATAGADYTAGDITLTFTVSETLKTCRIPVVNDDVVEANETIKLNLTGPTGGAVLGNPTSATLTIINDDVQATAPALQSLTPGKVVVTAPGAVATVKGSNFTQKSVVRVNGSARETDYVNATELQVFFSSADVSTVGNRSVTVYTEGAGTSNALTLTVTYSASDYDCNGAVTSADILAAMRSLAGIPDASPCGSFNPDGVRGLTMADILRMRQVVAGLHPL